MDGLILYYGFMMFELYVEIFFLILYFSDNNLNFNILNLYYELLEEV